MQGWVQRKFKGSEGECLQYAFDHVFAYNFRVDSAMCRETDPEYFRLLDIWFEALNQLGLPGMPMMVFNDEKAQSFEDVEKVLLVMQDLAELSEAKSHDFDMVSSR